MKNIPVKYQVTFGLIGILFSVMSLVAFTGILPDEREAIMNGRGQLSSSLAIQSSVLLNKREYKTIEKTLRSVVERDDEIISAGLRSRTGRMEVSAGEHTQNWETDENDRSLETHIIVPLYIGKRDWGQLEVRFKPLFSDRPTASWIGPKVLYVALVSILCVLAFAYYLGKVLKQLDPSKAVPKRVEDALNTLTEGLILTDDKGRIRLANDAFCKWVGRNARDLIGVNPQKLPWSHGNASGKTSWDIAASNTTNLVMPWETAIIGKRPVAGKLLQLPNQEGKKMTLIANASPIIGANGDYVGVLTSFEDVTDLEKHKVALAKAKQTADNANRAKSEFLARMSHEIRTPMNAILGYAEVLREGLEDDAQTRQQHLVTIHNSGEHLLALINDILDLSKIESGQMELEKAPVSIFQLMRDVVSVLNIKAEEKGIYLRSVYGGSMPLKISTDPVRLKQAIINLVGNAIKFTEEGGVTIHTQLVPGPKSTMLSIQVIDTGIGMSAEATQKIFQPFSQGDTSITRRFGGTGLGLAICKELSEKMGGSISVESEPGKGSTFNLTIDIGDISGVDLLDESDSRSKSGSKFAVDREIDVPPMHVLIVDDGETNRKLVSVYLNKANVTYETAENGQIAVDKVNSGNFDVVLMDMHMPVMDGFEATRLLRKQGHRIPIVALTANAMAQDEKQCRDAGCSGFLAKPISRERLLAELSMSVAGTVKTRRKTPTQTVANAVAPKEIPVTKEIAHTVVEPIENVSPTQPAAPTQLIEEVVIPEVESEAPADNLIGSTLPMDDEDFVYVAQLFVENLGLKVESMVDSLVNHEFDELVLLGHWLKGASGSAGYQTLSEPGHELESASKDKDLEACTEIIREICEMASRVHVNSSLECAN